MKKIIRYVSDEFPAINEIMNAHYNENDSWFNSVENSEKIRFEENIRTLEAEIVASATDEEQKDFLENKIRELSNANCDNLCPLCDMAFVEGFRAGAKILLEVLK